MADLGTLLKKQNRYLSKYLALSKEFFASLMEGQLSRIDEFEKSRGLLVRAMKDCDDKIAAVVGKNTLDALEAAGVAEGLRSELKLKKKQIEEILDWDTKIFEQIESSKDKLMQDAVGSKKEKEAIGKFKSGWVPKRGEGFDRTL